MFDFLWTSSRSDYSYLSSKFEFDTLFKTKTLRSSTNFFISFQCSIRCFFHYYSLTCLKLSSAVMKKKFYTGDYKLNRKIFLIMKHGSKWLWKQKVRKSATQPPRPENISVVRDNKDYMASLLKPYVRGGDGKSIAGSGRLLHVAEGRGGSARSPQGGGGERGGGPGGRDEGGERAQGPTAASCNLSLNYWHLASCNQSIRLLWLTTLVQLITSASLQLMNSSSHWAPCTQSINFTRLSTIKSPH